MLIAAGFPLRWNLRTSGIPALGPFPQLHMSKMRVFRPVEVRGTYQDLSLDMVRSTRRISMLTPSAGHHWWYGDFATGMASACPPAVSAILRVPDDPPGRTSILPPTAGHPRWYGNFATGMASACPPAVSAILRVPDDPPRAA